MAQPTMSSGRNTTTDRVAPREQHGPSSPPSAPGAHHEREPNPFAPPPKGAPDRPWQPRRPLNADEHDQGGTGDGAPHDRPPSSGDRWSSHQPEPQRGGWAGGPGGSRPQGGGPGRPAGSGPRFDVTDPVQRRARYALLSGMWGLFFGLFSMVQIGLLLGALALYWGVSSLRGKAKPQQAAASGGRAGSGAPAGPPYGPAAQKPQLTAAVGGILAGAATLAIVAVTFSFQLVYKDYFTCVSNALTQPDRQACTSLLPEPVRPMLGAQR